MGSDRPRSDRPRSASLSSKRSHGGSSRHRQRPSSAQVRGRSASAGQSGRKARLTASFPYPPRDQLWPCESELRVPESGRREVVFRFSEKGGNQLLPPSMQPPPKTPHPVFKEPFSQAIYNVDRVGGSRGWTTSQGEYGSVKPFLEKESKGASKSRLICDPNHPHWHTKPDPERAYVGLATSYMDLGQSMPPGSMKEPVFKLHSKTALYWPDWFGVKDPKIAQIERDTKDPRVG